MSYGVTESGFVLKPLNDILKEHKAVWKGTYGEDFDVSPESPAGQMIAFTAESESNLWELAEDIYNNQNPMTAYGIGLDLNCAIVGVARELSQYSYVYGQVFIGDVGSVIPIGSEFSVEVDRENKIYKTISAITLGDGLEEKRNLNFDILPVTGSYRLRIGSELTDFINLSDTEAEIESKINDLLLVGECIITKSDDLNIEYNLGKIVVDNFSVYSSDLKDIGDNLVDITITRLQAGEYQAVGNLKAVEKGAKTAFSYSLTFLESPITGIKRSFNPEDSTAGADIEEDDLLRPRRDRSLSTGKSTPSAISTALLNGVPNLNSAKVVENTSSLEDAVGRPPHCFEVYISSEFLSEDDIETIYALILEYKGAGIRPYGKNEKLMTDVDGVVRPIAYSLADEVDIYLIADISITDDYPENGDDQLKQDIVAWGNSLGSGISVIVYPDLMEPFQMKGIYRVDPKIGKSANPTTDANVVIGDGLDSEIEISNWDTSRIIINHV